ncbi:GNAT family N-acetyltransferase [Halobacillus yeomjeoni]|uniref:N-acetyltransferase n=1 Tax=Halobacillus yeomjeoni TaxID=311194 RepID=A0A931HWZ1_9BACI|nr:GNAT family N-acetyltransferase [Halobacillus yeomjeoni]MBH0230964.1 N-acetyltransferase [Halobacillus yeomjeoni]
MKQDIYVKPLSYDHLSLLKDMDTGIQDDYIIRVFERLISSESDRLFGLFDDQRMYSIAGYSLFGGGKFAMIGRLRTDRRFFNRGYSTIVLDHVMNQLQTSPEISWIGANTHVDNDSARRVLEKIGLHQHHVLHYLILNQPEQLIDHTKGKVWNKITNPSTKKELLHSLPQVQDRMFPYEAYYPLPLDQELFTEDYLNQTTFYQNHEGSRFVMVKNDTKKYTYSHVKYMWDDHYEQPGFFETILDHWNKNPDNVGCWIDFSDDGFNKIPDLAPFLVQPPWLMYGKWKKK